MIWWDSTLSSGDVWSAEIRVKNFALTPALSQKEREHVLVLFSRMKKNRQRIVWWVILAGVIIFHTTGIKPAVYGEFGPSEWVFSNYVDYTPEAVQQALDDKNDVVIYFGANRCPTCTGFEKRLLSTLDQIPDDLMIFAADVDRDTEAKAEYSVRVQSTTVYLWDSWEILTTRVARDHSLGDILGVIWENL